MNKNHASIEVTKGLDQRLCKNIYSNKNIFYNTIIINDYTITIGTLLDITKLIGLPKPHYLQSTGKRGA